MAEPTKTAHRTEFGYSPEYRRFLDRYIRRMIDAGIVIKPGEYSLAIQYSIDVHALTAYGLKAPRRLPFGNGGKRPGAGRPKKVVVPLKTSE
jgi:hypothetical protein